MNEKIAFKEKLAFGTACLGFIPIQTIIGAYLLIFYTNVVGLDPAACATMFLLAPILGIIMDPLIGYLIDQRPVTKYGHFRPIVLTGVILVSVNFLLLWFAPMLVPKGKIIAAYIFYITYSAALSVMGISFESLLPVMTSHAGERNSLSTIKGVSYSVGGGLLCMVAPYILGDVSNQKGYIRFLIFITVFVLVCMFLGIKGIKERVVSKAETKKYGLRDILSILKVKPVLYGFIGVFTAMLGSTLISTSRTYFFTYVWGDFKMLSISSIIQLAGTLVVAVFAGPLILRFGKKVLLIAALVLLGFISLIRLIDITSLFLLIIGLVTSSLGIGLCNSLMYSIIADNTDFIELHLGYRADGAVMAFTSFLSKLSVAASSAIPGYVLAMVGFNSRVMVQTNTANSGIVFMSVTLPALITLVGILLFGMFYPLTKKKLAEQNKNLIAARM